MKATKIIVMAIAALFAGCATANQKPTPDYEKYDIKYSAPMTQKLIATSSKDKKIVKSKIIASTKHGTKKVMARITYYSRYDDKWTAAGQTSTGKPLINKKVAAVDPKTIPYGSSIHLPKLGFNVKAVDTGSAVKSRKAARAWGQNVPVIDVYVANKKEAMKLAETMPMFQEVIISL